MQVILPFLFGFTVRKHIYLTITTVYTNYLEINALLLGVYFVQGLENVYTIMFACCFKRVYL